MKVLKPPVLKAGQYRLRPFEMRDAALIQEVWCDPLIPLISTCRDHGSHVEALEFIGRQHQRLVERSGDTFAVADATTDQATGQIGLWLKNANERLANIGHWISPNHRKRGAASALKTLSKWGFAQPGIHRLEL